MLMQRGKPCFLRRHRVFRKCPYFSRLLYETNPPQVLPPPGISQCTATGPAGNASVCLAYNMSFHAINEVFPVLQRQIAKDGGADGVIDVWGALNGTSCTTGTPPPHL